ncbi:MAG: RDD family protein [Bacteroidota bacterium]
MNILHGDISYRIPNYRHRRKYILYRFRNFNVLQRLKHKSTNAPILSVEYAGFGSRVIAALIDITLVFGVLYLLEKILIAFNIIAVDAIPFPFGIAVIIWILYNSLFESSFYQATIGKLVLRVKVIDLYGKRISFWNAFGRCISTIFSLLPFGFGVWYITTDSKKQAWHDLIAGTYVIKK